MANADHEAVRNIVAVEKKPSSHFLDLKIKLAGEILQKFATYRTKRSIMGDFSKHDSSSLKTLIFEYNRGKDVLFVPDAQTAAQRMTGQGSSAVQSIWHFGSRRSLEHRRPRMRRKTL